MEIFKKQTHIDFIGKRKLAFAFSATLIIIALGSLITRGLNFGLDFTGGTLIEVSYPSSAELDTVRKVLEGAGFDDAVVQHFGTSKEVLVRVAPHEGMSSAQIGDQVISALRKGRANGGQDIQMRRQEFVGPQVGDELKEDGGIAMLVALGCILIYVTLRFEYRLSVGSVAALVHDTLITIGVFSLFQLQFDLTVLAAVLAVIGYSLNDTIVVFDRIRENFRRMRKGGPLEIINASINQTLSRTIMTSGTTLLVVIALYVWGGELIHGFATALIVGIVIGTYSSIYVASALAMAMGLNKADLMPVKKEGAELDRP